MARKSQVTMFIIIGLLILLMMGFLYYAGGSLKWPVQKEHERETTLEEEARLLQEYVTNTLRQVFLDGLVLLGEQGGKIYDDTWPDDYLADRFPDGDQGGNSKYEPKWYLEWSTDEHRRIGFGIDGNWEPSDWFLLSFRPPRAAAPIDEYEGNIGPGAAGERFTFGTYYPLPPIDVEGGEESIEGQLKSYIEYWLPRRLDLTPFTDKQLQVTPEDSLIKAIVDIGYQDITVNLTYPMRLESQDDVKYLENFFLNIDYNFSAFYEYIHEIIEMDIYELDFDMGHEASTEIYEVWRGGGVFNDYEKERYYDVINLTDKTFLIDGKPYFFRFLRENRPPMNLLWWNYEFVYWYDESKILELHCPNWQTTHGQPDPEGYRITDPDEDDMYIAPGDDDTKIGPPWSDFNPEWYSYNIHTEKGPIHTEGGTCEGLMILLNYEKEGTPQRSWLPEKQNIFDTCGNRITSTNPKHYVDYVEIPYNDPCYVCDAVGTGIRDYGTGSPDEEMADGKKWLKNTPESKVKCGPANDPYHCCGGDGCWLEGEPGGCQPTWVCLDCDTYKDCGQVTNNCPNGRCVSHQCCKRKAYVVQVCNRCGVCIPTKDVITEFDNCVGRGGCTGQCC